MTERHQKTSQFLHESPKNSHTPFRIFLPGLTGGGRFITADRDLLHTKFRQDIFVPSSLISREGNRRGEGIKKHFQHLAQEILDKANGQDLDFIAHSSGGHEVIDLLQEIFAHQDSAKLKGRHVRINFISTPGLTGKGVKSALEILLALKEMGGHVDQFEQHMTFPLPESYYVQYPQQNLQNQQIETIFVDSENLRRTRRDIFLHDLFPKLLPEKDQQEYLRDQLATIDSQIVQHIAGGLRIDSLVKDRATLLAPYIQDLFHGKQIDTVIHEKYITEYRETPDNLAHLPRFYINNLLYIARIGRNIVRGMGKSLSDLYTRAQKKGIDLKITFTLLERDLITPLEKVDALKQEVVSTRIIDAVEGFYFAQQLAHSTVGYDPSLLVTLFEKL